MTYYTGLDVSLRSVSICIVDDTGAVQHEAKVTAEVDQVTACLRAFSQDAVVGFEAGTLTQYLTYGLQAAGFEAVYMEARQVAAALSAMRNKTDQIPRPGQPMAWPRHWGSCGTCCSTSPPRPCRRDLSQSIR